MAVSVQGRKVGNVVIVFGTFTHAIGAAAESLAVAGRVLGAIFQNCDATGEHDVEVPYSIAQSTTTGVSTITFYPNAAVTTGRFMVFTTG